MLRLTNLNILAPGWALALSHQACGLVLCIILQAGPKEAQLFFGVEGMLG